MFRLIFKTEVKIKHFLLCIGLAISGIGLQAQTESSILQSLRARQFNAAATQLKTYQGPHRALYEGIVHNAFNRHHASIQSLLLQSPHDLPDSLQFVYYKVINDDYVKIQDYKLAYQSGKILVTKYGQFFRKADHEDEVDAVKIWKCLRQTEPQQILKNGDAKLPFAKDLAGLHTLPVTIDQQTHDFVFDTGAGISCLTDSYAKLLHVNILSKEPIHVDGGTGASNPVRIGTVPELKIGNLTVKNAVFLIFQDSAFSFAGGAYKINGIIGFPIISGLGQITMTTDSLLVPANVPNRNLPHHNLAFVEMSPIIYLHIFDQEIPCLFDTGDADFSFSKPFYQAFSSRLQGEWESKTMAGAGGQRNIQAFMAQSLSFTAGYQSITPDKSMVDTENEHVVGPEIYGNIGQGIIKRFHSTTIDFVNAEIRFE